MRSFGFTRPHPSEVVSGDAWLVLEAGGTVRVALADGAGHGPAAAEAAQAALGSIRESMDRSIVDTLAVCHRLVRGSRGVAISIVDIGHDTFLFGGVGNVEARLITAESEKRFIPQRGILGVALPRVRPELVQLPASDWALLMYSDGISARLQITWTSITTSSPEELVTDAVTQWGRSYDDATLLLVRSG